MKKIAIVMIALCVVGTAVAEQTPETRAAAEKLLEIFNMDDTFEETIEQAMQMSFNMIDSQELSAADKAEAKKAMEASMKVTMEKFSWDNMKGMFVDVYADVLSPEELQGLIDFYESPVGQKFIKKQPELTRVTMQKMQVLMQDLMPAIQQEVEKAMAETKGN